LNNNKKCTFAPNFRNKKLRYLMVISNRPLRFIIATLVACLPLMSFANLDSVQVHTEVAHETTEKSQEGAHAEPTDLNLKSKRSLVITFRFS
jgi:F-type H+-transporting ATPase subunit a